MKIAYISTTYFADVDFCFLKELFKQADVTYILLYNKKGNATICNFKQCYPKTGLYKANIYPELEKYKDFINMDKTFILNVNSSKSYSLTFIVAYLKLFWFLLKGNFDIIHITKPFDYFAYILYVFRHKIVYSIHDPIDHSSSTNKRYLFNKKLSVKLLKNFIFYNGKQVEDFLNYFKIKKQDKKILISKFSTYGCLKINDIDCDNYPPNYILFFGTINSYKGLEYYFPAMKRIHETNPKVSFIIAGKGHYYFDISEYSSLDYIDIRNRYIPDEELTGLIKNCHFCVLPYVDATQSGVVMSAFAFNKPCVVTNVGGLPEMVIHNRHGLVIPPKDIESIVDSVIHLLENPEIISNMSYNIETDYNKGSFSWKAIADNTINFYNSL